MSALAPPARLKRFDVEPDGAGFTIRIEDEAGRAVVFSATRDQLDIVADALDDVLLHEGSPDDLDD